MSAPRLRIEPLGIAKRDGEGWRTSWRVTNLDAGALRIVGLVAPHSQFRGETTLGREIRGSGSTQVSLVVRVEGVAGSEIENAVLFVLLQQEAERWRVLARLRVLLEEAGRPRPRVEVITVQRVGFSGEL